MMTEIIALFRQKRILPNAVVVLLSVLLLTSCSSVSRVTLQTRPAGGIVTVQGVVANVQDGTVVELDKGEYVLTAAKEGYTGGKQNLTLEKAKDRVVEISLGDAFASVTVFSAPPGDIVQIQETEQVVIHGGRINLPPGTYTFILDKDGYIPGVVSKTLEAGDDVTLTVPRGAEEAEELPPQAMVNIRTKPEGRQITVAETGQVVADGEQFFLPAGSYTLVLAEEGYQRTEQKHTLAAGDVVELLVSRGPGIGSVEFSSTPPTATIRIDGGETRSLPQKLELLAGEHRYEVVAEGYYPNTNTLVVESGEHRQLAVNLEQVPTSGEVTVVADDFTGGTLVFQDRSLEAGTVDLGSLNFATYSVKAEKYLNSHLRQVGHAEFTVSEGGRQTVAVKPERKEYMFSDKWLPLEEARQLELQRYLAGKVDKPVQVVLDLSLEAVDALNMVPDFAEALHSLLRVGDRVLFRIGNREVTAWKRHTALTPEFAAEVGVLAGDEQLASWDEEPPLFTVNISAGKDPLNDLAFGLHGSRSRLALLDLTHDQLLPNGEAVVRTPADGEITIVCLKGDGVTLDGEPLDCGELPRITLVPAAAAPLSFQWQNAPARLLVSSENSVDLGAKLVKDTGEEAEIPEWSLPLAGSEALVNIKVKQKRLVRLATKAKVMAFSRLTFGPDYQGWQREMFDASGILSGQIDLGMDEIGLHSEPGMYERTWLVQIRSEDGISQRQLGVQYTVGNALWDGSSGRFFRRAVIEQPGD